MSKSNFLKEKIRINLFWDSEIDSSNTQIEIEYNKIILNGSVVTESSRLITREITEDFEVINESNFVCFGENKDKYNLERIKKILKRKGTLEEFNIDIKVKEVIVSLAKNINNENFYQELFNSVEYCQGVLSIENEILVNQNLKGREE